MRLPYPLDLVAARGGAVFEAPLSLNMVAVRHGRNTPGQGDDLLYSAWRETVGGSWTIRAWQAETEPGIPYLRTPMSPAGTAILVPGQYRGCWQRGLHHGRPALVQCQPVTVYRDANRNATIEISPNTDRGLFGINIHDVTQWNQLAGCVGLTPDGIRELLDVYDMTAQRYGPAVTLTLLEG